VGRAARRRPHIKREPFGMVFAPLLFFFMGGMMIGWASTPIDPRWAYVHPKRAAVVSAAGPIANLMLVVLAAFGLRLGVAVGWFLPISLGPFALAVAPDGGIGESLILVLSWVFSLNLILFVFNLIPVPPLDGSTAIGLLVSEENARRLQEWMRQPLLAFGGLLLAWLLMRSIVGPVLAFAVGVLFLGAA
jgi:Zn-dependent protease